MSQQYQQTQGQQRQQQLPAQQPGQGQQGMGGGRQIQQPRQFPTRSHLPGNVRTASIQRLNRCLADTAVLLTQAKYAHWNVKGMEFVGLHELFEDIYEDLDEHSDDIAERVTALGGQALGTVYTAATTSNIPAFSGAEVTGAEFVEAMADRLALHDANLAQDITAATEAGDLDTADLLNEVSRDVAKHRWMLEAHLQTRPGAQIQAGGAGMGQVGTPATQQ